MNRGVKFALAAIGGTVVMVAGYESGFMPLAGIGFAILVIGLWWAKLSR